MGKTWERCLHSKCKEDYNHGNEIRTKKFQLTYSELTGVSKLATYSRIKKPIIINSPYYLEKKMEISKGEMKHLKNYISLRWCNSKHPLHEVRNTITQTNTNSANPFNQTQKKLKSTKPISCSPNKYEGESSKNLFYEILVASTTTIKSTT